MCIFTQTKGKRTDLGGKKGNSQDTKKYQKIFLFKNPLKGFSL